MRLFRYWISLVCALVCAVACQMSWADPPAAAENDAAAKKEVAEENEPEDKEPEEKEPEEKELLRKPLVLKPKDIAMPVPERAVQAATKPQAAAKPHTEKKRAIPAAVRRPNPLFWSPRQGKLNAAATYRLESMGRHVHLSPAMRFHLQRAGGAANVSPNTLPSPAAGVAKQGAEKFYPGVSRLPSQKPFANLERPAPGFQRYWPLLLEGREDPNTGLIIWSLP